MNNPTLGMRWSLSDHEAAREERRKRVAQVPVDSLIYEITGEWRRGEFVLVTSATPARVIGHGDYGCCLVIADARTLAGPRCITLWSLTPG